MSSTRTATLALERLAAAFDGTLAVAAQDTTTGEALGVDAERPMGTASVIKLAVLVAVFERARAGEVDLGQRLTLGDEGRVSGSGVIKELAVGTQLTIRDLATYMIVVSDNMATNLLIDVAGGVEAVNRYVQDDLGLGSITLHRKLMQHGARGHVAVAAPRDLVALLSGLQTATIVSPQGCREMIGMLARQQYLDQVPRLFDRERLDDEERSDGRFRVANKTGMVNGVRADAGLLWLDGRQVSYAVMAESADDGGRDLDAEGQLVCAEAGWILVSHLWPAGSGPPPLAVHPAPTWSRLHAAANTS